MLVFLENVTTSHGWASPVIKIGGVVLAHSLRAFKLQYYLASDKILLWWHSSSSLSLLPEWTKKGDGILVVDFTKTLSIHRENYVTRIDLKKQSFIVDLKRRILWRNDCLALTLLDLATAVPGKISDMMMGKLCSLPPMMAIPRSSAGFFSIIACFPRLVVWEEDWWLWTVSGSLDLPLPPGHQGNEEQTLLKVDLTPLSFDILPPAQKALLLILNVVYAILGFHTVPQDKFDLFVTCFVLHICAMVLLLWRHISDSIWLHIFSLRSAGVFVASSSWGENPFDTLFARLQRPQG